MDGKQFFNSVASHPDLNWLGVKEDEDYMKDVVFIESKTTGRRYSVDIQSIKDTDWIDFKAVFIDGREPFIMKHFTRIVGYYSNLVNWNPSKIAELNDRRKGNYTFPEPSEVRVTAD